MTFPRTRNDDDNFVCDLWTPVKVKCFFLLSLSLSDCKRLNWKNCLSNKKKSRSSEEWQLQQSAGSWPKVLAAKKIWGNICHPFAMPGEGVWTWKGSGREGRVGSFQIQNSVSKTHATNWKYFAIWGNKRFAVASSSRAKRLTDWQTGRPQRAGVALQQAHKSWLPIVNSMWRWKSFELEKSKICSFRQADAQSECGLFWYSFCRHLQAAIYEIYRAYSLWIVGCIKQFLEFVESKPLKRV